MIGCLCPYKVVCVCARVYVFIFNDRMTSNYNIAEIETRCGV